MSKREEFIALYARDVRENPDCFKACVVADPEAAAERLVVNLDESECAVMLRDLKAELRQVAKLTGVTK